MDTVDKCFIKALIEQIEKDYQTPKFKTEVTLDTIISIFIDDILKHELQTEHIIQIAKEFPLKKENNQSTNIDFLHASEKTLYFTELKTSHHSFSKAQLTQYHKIIDQIGKNKNIDVLKQDYEKIIVASRQKEKYNWQNSTKGIDYFKKETSNINGACLIYIGPSSLESDLLLEINPLLQPPDIKYLSLSKIADLELNTLTPDRKEIWNCVKPLFKKIDELDEKY